MTRRQTGQTTKQIKEAPRGAVFVWCNHHFSYPLWLLHKHDRRDLELVGPDWLKSYSYVGRELTGLVIDHAIFSAEPMMTDAHRDQLEYHIERAKTRVRLPPVGV